MPLQIILRVTCPRVTIQPDQLTSEDEFGDHIQGKEFRLNLGGSEKSRNVNTGQRGFSLDYNFAELGGNKKSFGILSMLTLPTDHTEADTAVEVFCTTECHSCGQYLAGGLSSSAL